MRGEKKGGTETRNFKPQNEIEASRAGVVARKGNSGSDPVYRLLSTSSALCMTPKSVHVACWNVRVTELGRAPRAAPHGYNYITIASFLCTDK